MRVRQMSPRGDYTWGQSELNFLVNTPQAVGQVVGSTLRLWQGEWFLDLSLGVPYPSGVLGRHPQSTADTTIKNAILTVQGIINGVSRNLVTDIPNFVTELNSVTRNYDVTASINTVFGTTKIEIENFQNF